VTFERKDPFYVIGFDDPKAPEILGQMVFDLSAPYRTAQTL
jgi:uncharacterized secreted protein with C-terminal beta-propeller domain